MGRPPIPSTEHCWTSPRWNALPEHPNWMASQLKGSHRARSAFARKQSRLFSTRTVLPSDLSYSHTWIIIQNLDGISHQYLYPFLPDLILRICAFLPFFSFAFNVQVSGQITNKIRFCLLAILPRLDVLHLSQDTLPAFFSQGKKAWSRCIRSSATKSW